MKSEIDKMFEDECKEIGVDYSEFPYSFEVEKPRNWNEVIKGFMWILKKRQDKYLNL